MIEQVNYTETLEEHWVIDFKCQAYFKEKWSVSKKKNGRMFSKSFERVVGIKYKLILNKSYIRARNESGKTCWNDWVG